MDEDVLQEDMSVVLTNKLEADHDGTRRRMILCSPEVIVDVSALRTVTIKTCICVSS